MDGYVLADWMESRHQGLLEVAKSLLVGGDGGDKLYAAIYLLSKSHISLPDANDVIEHNCETPDTRWAWRAIARYVWDTTTPLFESTSFLDKSEIQTNITFYNLLPMVIRCSDKREAISHIEALVSARAELRDDMEEVVTRIKAR